MHLRRLLPLLSLFLLAVPARAQEAAPAPAAGGLLPVNDNTAPPYFAVYRWGQGGVGKGLYDAYGPWLNRKVMWAEDFMPSESWDKVEGQEWQLGTWKGWVQKQAGRRLVLSVPLLVGPWDGKGPKAGPGAGVAVSLAEGAKGTYNVYFQHLAENLVKQHLGDTILRLGWEFNGGWYQWRAQKEPEALNFAAYFKQIVTTMRAVPGAENLKFCWNPAMEPWWPYSPEKAWPGDDVVDYVGVDVYDQSWQKETYPFPEGADAATLAARQQKTWETTTNSLGKMGLPYWKKFAADHGKPLAIPEWGVCQRQDKHGGMDNAYFIEQMFRFIHDPANNVFFHCYFDVGAPDGDHQLCPNPNNDKKTQFPLAAAKYVELFALPGQ
ncbi:Glycosyl hydrolase family 26 [Verrucomicrobium sp. GAS474]|uniref:glycosyl hydrolase n=1 Tax=Verrucomicrobium sp. GAS474 TaxID=1882831 RepID=UPI000879EEDC|nr:glycosyl hydrolase [Verrucomicrobium sp. GAS474]SDT95071.1 Glycosyl hydrolase family 26 [Verrucomicrobium sp. GAS474]